MSGHRSEVWSPNRTAAAEAAAVNTSSASPRSVGRGTVGNTSWSSATTVLEQGIDTTTAEGRMVYRMLAAVGEFQRDLIVANTDEGPAAARARGRKGGRRPKLTAHQAELAQQLYDAHEKTVQEIADLFTVPRSTIYGYLNKETRTVAADQS